MTPVPERPAETSAGPSVDGQAGKLLRTAIEPRGDFWFSLRVRLSFTPQLLAAGTILMAVATSLAWGQAEIEEVPAVPALNPPDPGEKMSRAMPIEAPAPRAPSRKREVLRPVLEPNHLYRYVQRIEVTLRLPGRGSREAEVERQIRLDVSPRPSGEEGVAVKVRSERLQVNLRSRERELSYDSLEKEDRESALGKHFRGSLTGWVELELDGDLDVVSESTGGATGIETPFPGLPDFGPESLRRLVALLPQGFPQDPVAPGDRWEIRGERSISEAGDGSFDIACRYAGDGEFEDHACARIDLSGRLSGGVPLSGSGDEALAKGRLGFEGAQLGGQILFDRGEKVMRFSEHRVGMLLELPGRAGGDGEEAPPVRVPLEQRTTLRLLHVVATGGEEE